ncbi:MAG: AAA family ATPase [Lachnospiraceae bacterium]|nr:AAA family ATPase [Lachnospiraceae bacterium]
MNANVEKIKSFIEQRNLPIPSVISIDGPCASGKSTLAKELETLLEVNILHMDDFYLPFQKRDKNWMNIVAGHMDFERLIENVLKPYKAKRKTNYISYDCHSDMYLQEIPIDLEKILIIEGSYSSHPTLNDYVDLKIFIEVDRDEQVKRLTNRNKDTVDKFLSMWVPFENNYFETLKIREKSDLVIVNG